MSSPVLEVEILDKAFFAKFPLPAYATSGSAGLDLRACLESPLVLAPNATALVSSGLAVYIQDPALVGVLVPRSGLGHKNGIILGNTVGIIDADYHGPLMISLWNRSPVAFTIAPGDRVAQLLLLPVVQATLRVVDHFSLSSQRGTGGFGSSGTA